MDRFSISAGAALARPSVMRRDAVESFILIWVPGVDLFCSEKGIFSESNGGG